jgi:transposase
MATRDHKADRDEITPYPRTLTTSARAYKDRNRIERMFNKLKQFRRIATLYDKTAVSFLGFLALAAAKLWMQNIVNRA